MKKLRKSDLMALRGAGHDAYADALEASGSWQGETLLVPSAAWKGWPSFRLGDAVERVAKPIARIIDMVAGTKLANCQGCAKRRDKLNRLL